MISKVKEKFLTNDNPDIEDDTHTFEEQERRIDDLEQVKEILDSSGGKVIKRWLTDEIDAKMRQLLATKIGDSERDSLISDLKSHVDLFNKLKVDDELDGIREYLNSLLDQ